MRFDTLIVGRSARGSGGRGSMPPDSILARRVVRGGSLTTRIASGDTIYTLRYDSLLYRDNNVRGAFGLGAIAMDSGGRGFGGRGGRGGFTTRRSENGSGGYRAGWIDNAPGAIVNHALGLEATSDNRSGIQGLGPLFVESADTYFFAPRELTSSNLRVMVVHLTPSSTWRGPS